MTHNITKCRSCGADIIFITTENGRKMPCDAAAVDYQDNIKGKDVVVTDAGKVLKASVVRPTQSGLVPLVDGKGYTPHWATCPFAKEHRGSRK